MKRVFIILISLSIISCKKETNYNLNNIKKEIITDNEKVLRTDTISISGNDTKSNYILASLLKKTISKDSIETDQYNLEFYQNNTKTESQVLTINDCVKGSEWIANYGLSTDGDSSSSPFIRINFGLQVSGYLQKEYLFYLANKKIQLIKEWESSSDGGWGAWTEFLNVNPKNVKQTFYCRDVSFDPKDDSGTNIGIASYSDSTKIYFENGKWKKQLLTSKGKVYRKKESSLDDFYPQQ